ncbi:cation efflux family-domain-containing protein [Podospora aff. communis PSN243]|uniref:Cation efflux family-domain-containing protein n=1 Tax=Podospora aff. communis PSN243 TaxID=3040156 RepID=A0AAV9GLJ4_9PEZI|nr:cation efflux family-domain-containing protein [Podospora aff. communis PSN243]
MDRRLLRSITFHPHWFGHYHVLPCFQHHEPPRKGRDTHFQTFSETHQEKDLFNLLSVYQDPESLLRQHHPDLAKKYWYTPWWPPRRRALLNFYTAQNTTIELILRSPSEHQSHARSLASATATRVQIAIYASLAANVLLSGLQLFAAVSSGSLSLFTTMADAIFDPLSNIMLILANRAVKHVDPRRFPSGRARLETSGNIVFCFLMMAVSVVIISFSVEDIVRGLASPGREEVNGFHVPAVVAAGVSFGTKMVLFLYCGALRERYSQVRIVWQDHRNDLFINGLGILTSVGGAKVRWWVDPAGAIVLSVGIAVLWARTAVAEFMMVVGAAATPDVQRLVTYVSLVHDVERVRGIDTVRVYYSGPRLIVEVDVVMAGDTKLEKAHDVSEGLQYKLESLPNVERAYVHVDYETSHKPEHAVVKKL